MKQLSCTVLVAALLSACIGPKLQVAPVTVEPIHLTIDVNLHDGEDDPDVAPAKPPAR